MPAKIVDPTTSKRSAPTLTQMPPVAKVTVIGTLTNEGNGNQTSRQGAKGEFYIVIPRAKLRGIKKGDHVCVTGTIGAVSYSQEGTSIVVVWSSGAG